MATRRCRRLLRWLVPLALLGLVARTLSRSRESAQGIPFSPVFGRGRIGADFPERRGIATDEEPVGEMDEMAAFDRSAGGNRGFDAGSVDPAVRDFYERTSAYAMQSRTWWYRGFRLGASLAAPLTSRIEQLNLPGPGEPSLRRLQSRFVRLRPDADPRRAARAWVRTDAETGEAVFVALYADHEDGTGERFVNIAAPLPGANLSTVLRMRHLTSDDDSETGVELTTRGDGDPGLYLITPLGAIELPMEQRFRVWPADRSGAPAPIDPRASLVASHEMWVLGRQFLTVEYAMWEAEAGQASTSTS